MGGGPAGGTLTAEERRLADRRDGNADGGDMDEGPATGGTGSCQSRVRCITDSGLVSHCVSMLFAMQLGLLVAGISRALVVTQGPEKRAALCPVGVMVLRKLWDPSRLCKMLARPWPCPDDRTVRHFPRETNSNMDRYRRDR